MRTCPRSKHTHTQKKKKSTAQHVARKGRLRRCWKSSSGKNMNDLNNCNTH